MNEILNFTKEMASRRSYKRFLNKAEDAAAVQSLDTQLTHAFQIFEVGTAHYIMA
jgi:hypothetical protein